MMQLRKELSGDHLIKSIRSRFEGIDDHRRVKSVKISLVDALMSGYALFSLKFPSLLQFEEEVRKRRRSSNLRSLFRVTQIPSDTQMREILDEVDPDNIRTAFVDLFRKLQRGKVLKEMTYYKGHYLLSIDGTGYFSSNEVHCDRCLRKKRVSTGETILYFHQMVAGQLVHPGCSQVIPFCPEPVQMQEGNDKNDCERRSVKRFLTKFRNDHPQLKIIVLADSLMSNGTQIKELQNHQMSYLMSARPGNHQDLFREVEGKEREGKVVIIEKKKWTGDKVRKKITQQYRFVNNIQLTKNHPKLRINFLDYREVIEWKCKGEPKREELHFSWVTDLEINKDNVDILMRGGRSRWRIENEGFNTLKNHGYGLDHNYGHGYKNLTTVFASLMMLAFLVDQIQSLSCELFQKLQSLCIRQFRLWKCIREAYFTSFFESWTDLLKSIEASYEQPIFDSS